MSGWSSVRIALATILLGTSPIPIGRTPGHLSKGINLQATKALKCSGCMLSIHNRLPRAARAEHSSFEADLKELQSRLQL